jgi:hypothetical protein
VASSFSILLPWPVFLARSLLCKVLKSHCPCCRKGAETPRQGSPSPLSPPAPHSFLSGSPDFHQPSRIQDWEGAQVPPSHSEGREGFVSFRFIQAVRGPGLAYQDLHQLLVKGASQESLQTNWTGWRPAGLKTTGSKEKRGK